MWVKIQCRVSTKTWNRSIHVSKHQLQTWFPWDHIIFFNWSIVFHLIIDIFHQYLLPQIRRDLCICNCFYLCKHRLHMEVLMQPIQAHVLHEPAHLKTPEWAVHDEHQVNICPNDPRWYWPRDHLFARFMSFVTTVDANPYLVSLACRIASSVVLCARISTQNNFSLVSNWYSLEFHERYDRSEDLLLCS